MKQVVFFAILTVTMFLNGCVGVSQTFELPPTIVAPTLTPTQTPQPTLTAAPTQTARPVQTPLPNPTALPTQALLPSPGAVPQAIPTAEGGGAVQDPTVEKLIALAVQDLTARANVSADEVAVKSVAPMEWRDTSLGCPREGMMYAQMITPGYLIVLEANGKTYEYHTSYSNVVYCEE